MVTNAMPMKSIYTPVFIILVIGTYPLAYTIALGGVETGNIKPKDAERATPTATGTGEKPADTAAPMASGPIMLVAAE